MKTLALLVLLAPSLALGMSRPRPPASRQPLVRAQAPAEGFETRPSGLLVPTVIEKTPNGERGLDIYSRLLKDRIIFLDRQVDEHSASVIIAQLLHLESEDAEKDIHLYIMSPGGSVAHGLGILDTMHYISPDVSTIALGQAASMGALLLAAGAKGKRFALPNARIMIHQPSGGAQGQATDIAIQSDEILRYRKVLNQMLADYTGQPLRRIQKDVERDTYKDPYEAKDYGLIDEVITKRPDKP